MINYFVVKFKKEKGKNKKTILKDGFFVGIVGRSKERLIYEGFKYVPDG